jgi:lipopolysaccharide transport system ATP-binding protein
MSEPVIRVEKLGKRFRIGKLRTHSTLRDTLAAAVKAPFRPRDPQDDTILWALRDVSFEVNQGDVVGLIGRNGAGKSTLLKLLARITRPTEGWAEIHGRIGSLLEVGTGFHPELSGRENVFLSGAVLGMKKAEIARKFDEIVAFSEVERFLDTPLKHYSSGMQMRLAFAVAAHLEPEILLVDEVLAVGDASFQKKCLGKMNEVARHGRTILFVSHNMGSLMQLCKFAIGLENGRIKRMGTAIDTVRAYMAEVATLTEIDTAMFQGTLTKHVEFRAVRIANGESSDTRVISPGVPVRVAVSGYCHRTVPNFRTTLSVFREGVRLLTMHDVEVPETLADGPFHSEYEIPARFLRPGEYSIAVGGYRDGMDGWLWAPDIGVFTVTEEWGRGYDPINIGFVNVTHYGTRTIGDSLKQEAQRVTRLVG